MARIEKVSNESHEGDAVCLTYYENKVFSGGADGKIKVWDNDLNLIRTIDAHDAYMYAIVVSSSGKVYSSCCDGTVKYLLPPYDNSSVQELLRCEDAIQAMYCDGEILYTGDEKGTVTNWQNERMLFKFNLVEEVKSLAAEKSIIFTVRDLDVVVSDVVAGKSGKYSNKAVIPGKSPLALIGPIVDSKHTFLVFADRTGKGLSMVRNLPHLGFARVWDLQDCHEMIVNSICGDENCLYSGGYDKKVKGWTDLDNATPKYLGEVDVGSCVNSICCGANKTVYIASSDGVKSFIDLLNKI